MPVSDATLMQLMPLVGYRMTDRVLALCRELVDLRVSV